MQGVFLLVSGVGLLSALGVVLARNLVHAALFLVAFFFAVACQFVLLEAEFLAAMQVLVYIGAVSILILFGIMLTPDIGGQERTGRRWAGKGLAAVVGLALLGTLVLAAARGTAGEESEPWAKVSARPGGVNPALDGPEPARAAAIVDMPRAIGVELMTRQLVAFELAGLMLTAALVGAIALARADRPGAEQVSVEGRELSGIAAGERA
jgi:NADH-quinone oxidoreductase subunit J